MGQFDTVNLGGDQTMKRLIAKAKQDQKVAVVNFIEWLDGNQHIADSQMKQLLGHVDSWLADTE